MSTQTWFIVAVGVMVVVVVTNKLVAMHVRKHNRSTGDIVGQEWEAFDPTTQRVIGRAGVSFHLTPKDLDDFVREHFEGFPEHPARPYARPAGLKFTGRLSPKDWERVKKSRNGWLDKDRGMFVFGMTPETPTAKLL